jgi:hypothetical protein
MSTSRISRAFRPRRPDDIKGLRRRFFRAVFSGVVQIWSAGSCKESERSPLVRPPVQPPRSQTFECYEGILETDRWFGPLFINITPATDRPIEINTRSR